jgi:hypothetical protein
MVIMKQWAIVLCCCAGFWGCSPGTSTWDISCNARALAVGDAGQVWYAGSDGCVGEFYGGRWHHANIAPPSDLTPLADSTFQLAFRSLALRDDGSALVLGITSPALLYAVDGTAGSADASSALRAKLVHRCDASSAFFDAMINLGDGRLVAMGDPIDSCSNLPIARPGEAAFAASNTNLCAMGDTVWMVSGGGASRVFRSLDAGTTWGVFDTPLVQGGTMTGAFTMDFANSKTGIIWGGDWEDMPRNSSRAAITHDGGATWELLAEGTGPGYFSCVQHRPGSGGREWAGVCAGSHPSSGLHRSLDGGQSWTRFDTGQSGVSGGLSDSLLRSAFYTCRFSPNGERLWLAGRHKVAVINW